jgi:beta-xylosidase
MNKSVVFLLVFSSLLFLPACSSAPEPIADVASEESELEPSETPSTATAQPTDSPTATPEPTLAPTPEGQIFRDEFSGELESGWRWENENPDNWSYTDDGFLEIIGQDEYDLENAFPFNNMLLRDLPPGDIAVTIHMVADPDTNFQQAAIWLWENGDTFVVLNHGFCDPCGGKGIYFDYTIPGLEPTSYQLPGIEEADVYLRMEIRTDTIELYYATEEGQWERVGRFGNLFDFRQVGIGVSNIDPFGSDDDLVAQFDWFEITSLP